MGEKSVNLELTPIGLVVRVARFYLIEANFSRIETNTCLKAASSNNEVIFLIYCLDDGYEKSQMSEKSVYLEPHL